MNCKTLYRGPVSYHHLKNVSNKVLKAIASTIFENFGELPIRDKICLLLPDAYFLAQICDKVGIDEVEVIEQFQSSVFYQPYKCNFRVRLFSNRIYSVFVS